MIGQFQLRETKETGVAERTAHFKGFLPDLPALRRQPQ